MNKEPNNELLIEAFDKIKLEIDMVNKELNYLVYCLSILNERISLLEHPVKKTKKKVIKKVSKKKKSKK